MTLTAIYTEQKGGIYNTLVNDYNTKENFRKDIIANGMHCVAIFTPEQLQNIKNDEHALTNYLNLSERLISYIKEVA